MRNPTVSVIIPTYNRAHCLGEAINSVLAQSYKDFEIIVVDDGSTDATIEKVRFYGDRIRLIQQNNLGASSARNTGIRAARGEWIAFLDSDDLWEPEKLEVQMNDLQSRPDAVASMLDADIVFSDVRHVTIFELRKYKEIFHRCPFIERPLLDVLKAVFFTPTWLIRRKTIESAGMFDTNLKISEDYDLLARIALEGPFVVNCYVGAKIRRIGNSHALSNLYNENKLEYLYNNLHTYRNLLKDKRLTIKEYRSVRRSIGGLQCDIFVQQRNNKKYSMAIGSLIHSVLDDPGFRSILRAITVSIVPDVFFSKITSLVRDNDFRRSNMS